MTSASYRRWFEDLFPGGPHPWQLGLGEDPICRDRLLRVPTGFGKTAGVVLPWLYHRVVRGDLAWPTRLAFTLPMRVLVEQTAENVRSWIAQLGLEGVEVGVLMAGEDSDSWVRHPERPSVLVGTQDMLLSRALNRAYGTVRARWPMDFGLLSEDVLWVLDEIQLMGVGLMTGTQLSMFRADDRSRLGTLRPSHTWWMSATLQPSWLESVDSRGALPELTDHMVTIPERDRQGGLWSVRKAVTRRADVTAPAEIAQVAANAHRSGGLTLVVVNRVTTAVETFDALVTAFSTGKGKASRLLEDAPDLRLVHSRFRGTEKAAWAGTFLSKEKSAPGQLPPSGRIVVATQVVEAGVDISAGVLVTELAPWPSLVQRFGRCARYEGESGEVIVVGAPAEDEKKSAPYTPRELSAAAEGLDELVAAAGDVAPAALEKFEEALRGERRELLQRLYPYEPGVVLRRHVIDELFDTTPDLSGVDLDVSQYIRADEERDVALFWREIAPQGKGASKTWSRELPLEVVGAPQRNELCPAPLSQVRRWLSRDSPAWVLDYQSKCWIRRRGDQLVPGQQVLIASSFGGYSTERGFVAGAKAVVPEVRSTDISEWSKKVYAANAAEDDDSLSITAWKTIGFHGFEVAKEVDRVAEAVGLPPDVRRLLRLAGRWHDVGKVHEVFQDAIKGESRESGGGLAARRDLAKAPDGAWKRYERPGFRHELASVLALFELLRRVDPMHEALLGPHRELLALMQGAPVANDAPSESLTPGERSLGEELAQLGAEEFDLVAWLVCSHHGKVRCTWTSTPKDQAAGRGHIHGVGDGDVLPSVDVLDEEGQRRGLTPLPVFVTDLAALGLGPRYGASWRERVERLLRRRGPFQLAFLEAVFRAADWRASALPTEEPLP